MKKKLLAVLMGAVMTAAMTGGMVFAEETEATTEAGTEATTEAGSETAEEETSIVDTSNVTANEAYHFEIVVKSYQSSYWQAAVQGIEAEAEALGVTVNCTGPNQESDIADQVNMLNNAINQKPDGIGLAACDQESVLEALQTAMDQGIPVVCFDAGVPDAPEGSVYSTIATDNYGAGAIAADHLYEALRDKITSSESPVRIGEVNQEATSDSIINRGLGFIDRMIELAAEDGLAVAVVGNEYYVNNCSDAGDEASANIIIDVAVPAQTTVELCATEASNILNKADTIGIFGSNQVAAEGILTANGNLNVLGSDPSTSILAAGFDAGSTIKAAVTDGTMFGAVTQSPLAMGKNTVDVLTMIANGEEVTDIPTDGYWYDSTNIDDESIAPNLYD